MQSERQDRTETICIQMISDSSVRTHRTHNFSKRMPFWNSECRSAEMLSLKHTRIF